MTHFFKFNFGAWSALGQSIKWSEVNMKRLLLIFIMSYTYFGISSGQTLTDQIEHAYSSLDSASYINHVILSYARWLDKQDQEAYKILLDIFCSDNDSMKVAEGHNKVDSMYCEDLKRETILNTQSLKQFESVVKGQTPVYVLTLKLKDERTLQVDTGKLTFHLFYFDKKCKGSLYVYCDKGEYSWQDERYRTFLHQISDNAPKVFRKIMRKHPRYLLCCPDLEGMNTILYVIGNDVYIYRIAQMQKYKLDDYMRNRSAMRNS